MAISLIVAMSQNRVIGKDNQLPWRLPADMKLFRNLTMGKAVVMGRKTYESMGRPLPGRQNIILSRDETYQAEGCQVVHSPAEALSVAESEEVMVIGGATIYELFLPGADRIYLTLIEAQLNGDTYFPVIDPVLWQETARLTHEADEHNAYRYHFLVYERRSD